MKIAFLIAALLSLCLSASSALAESGNVGEPFGRAVVSPAAKAGEIKDAVHENVPGGLDDVVQSNLADDEEGGDIRGHGRKDAPGHNK